MLKQIQYNKRWRNKHKWRNRQISYRTTAKTFIRKYGNNEDLVTLILMCIKYLIKAGQMSEVNYSHNIDWDSPNIIKEINKRIKALNPNMKI